MMAEVSGRWEGSVADDPAPHSSGSAAFVRVSTSKAAKCMMQTMVTGWRKAAGAGRAPPDRGGRGRASNEAGPDVETTVEVVGVRSGIGLRNTRREGSCQRHRRGGGQAGPGT